MRILQLGKFYPIRGGVEKVMYDLMLGLSNRGVYCDMLCAASKGQRSGIIELNGCGRLLCMPALMKLKATMISPAMIFILFRIKDEYDVIHIHHPDPMAALALFLCRYKGKVVLHWHSDIVKQRLLLLFYFPLQTWLIKRADVIVGTSPVYTANSPYLRNVRHKVVSVPIGIERPLRYEKPGNHVKKQYVGKKIIFSLGRLVSYKGYRHLIEAARFLGDDCVVLIGGEGPLRKDLQELIKQEGLQNKVELLGFLSDEELPAYFEACDLFCLSSIQKTEAFAIVQVEAMAYGKPVVATRIKDSGVSWVNKHGISGLNVEPGSGQQLAEAISTILKDELLYSILADGAYKRYNEMFTCDKMIDKSIRLYRKLLNKQLIILPNNPFLKEAEVYLKGGKRVSIHVCGTSMLPFLQHGDLVFLDSPGKASIHKGSIVLAHTRYGYRLHRVIHIREDVFTLAGDANVLLTERTVRTDVVGVVTTAYRNGVNLQINGTNKRVASQLWLFIKSFRRCLLKMYKLIYNKKIK